MAISATASMVSPFTILKAKPKNTNQVIGHGDFTYRVDASWGNLDPATTPVNNCHEMIMDKRRISRRDFLVGRVKNYVDL